jgi:hypothetical protein
MCRVVASVGNADFSAGLLGYSDVSSWVLLSHHLTEPNESLIVGTSKLPSEDLPGMAGCVHSIA